MTLTSLSVACIGLGRMGAGIAHNIQASGMSPHGLQPDAREGRAVRGLRRNAGTESSGGRSGGGHSRDESHGRRLGSRCHARRRGYPCGDASGRHPHWHDDHIAEPQWPPIGSA